MTIDSPLWSPRRTARRAVIDELRQRGTARNAEIARTLGLKTSTVGSILHWLRAIGCVRRLKMGLYQFVRMPEYLSTWQQDLADLPLVPAPGATMPEKIINLLKDAPNQSLGFLALWKRSGLSRQATGAVLSKLLERGVLERPRRGRYHLLCIPRPDKGWPDLILNSLTERPWQRISEIHRHIEAAMSEDTLRKILRRLIAERRVVRRKAFYGLTGEQRDLQQWRNTYAAQRPRRKYRRRRNRTTP